MNKLTRTLSAIFAVSALTVPANASDSIHISPAAAVSAQSTGESIEVWFDGALVCPGQTLLIASSTYLPLRAFCRGLGIEDIAWDTAGIDCHSLCRRPHPEGHRRLSLD